MAVMRSRSEARKGMTNLKVSFIGTSLAMLLMMNTFMPTGGVIRPISTTISTMMPNQMALASLPSPPISSPMTMGKKIGMVSKIIDRLSMMQPSTR